MSTKAAQVDERREKERRRKIADAYLRQMAFQAATLLGAGTGSAGIFNEYWKWKHGQDGLAAGVVALSSSAMAYGGFIEFLLTQATGAITDKYGRKWTFFITPSLMTVASFSAFFFPKNLKVIFSKAVIGWSFAAIYGGMAHTGAALSDICEGEELGAAYSRLFAYIGIGVLSGQFIGSKVYEWTGQAKYSMLAQGILAMAQWAHNYLYIEETHPVEKRRTRPISLSDLNPFGFIKLLTTNKTLMLTSLFIPFAHCAEGKHTSAIRDMWVQDDLNFSLPMRGYFMSFWSACAICGGLVGSKLVKLLGRRNFTTVTTYLNVLGFYVISRKDVPYSVWLGFLLMLPGFNANHCSAIRSYATDHAVKAGFGKGEFAASIAIMRGLSVIIATPIYSWAYRYQKSRGLTPRLAWFSVIFLGALVPEFLHRMLSSKELESVNEGKKKRR